MLAPHMRSQETITMRAPPGGPTMPRVLTDAEVQEMARQAAEFWARPGWFVPERPSAKREPKV